MIHDMNRSKKERLMKNRVRLVACLLALASCMALSVGCAHFSSDPATTSDATSAETAKTTLAETTGTVTDLPARKLTVDSTYHITVPKEADEMTRKTADFMAEVIREVTGLQLNVATADEYSSTREIFLHNVLPNGGTGYRVEMLSDSLHIFAADSATLYFAVNAILETWLTADFGLAEEGSITLSEDRVADLNGLATRLDTSIRILSQNMRGTDDPDGNTIQLRSERFVRQVEEYQPDLIGTQEYTYNWQLWLKKQEKKMGGTEETRIYGQVGCSRDGRESKSGEWNAILYRLDRFELLDSDTFWLSDTPGVPSVTVANKDKRICTWAKLKDKKTGEILVYANTHLDHTDDSVRNAQVAVLMEQLAIIAGDYPLYLTGDFNCGVGSSPYSVVAGTLQDAHRTAWQRVSADCGTFHDYNPSGYEIDFVFHDSHATPVRYEIIAKQYDGYVSDHYGVFAELVYGISD